MSQRVRTISSICSHITSGGTPSRKCPEYYSESGNGHVWIKSKELLDRAISGSEEQISALGLKKSSAKYIPAKSVLVGMYGANVGQLGWLRVPATVNQAICALTTDPNIADSKWLFYALLDQRHRLVSLAQGAAQQNISQEKIKSFELELPDILCQRRIASILSAYDDLIENNTRRIEILEEMARRLYEEWFVHFRFPGHEQVNFKETELGRIPEGWDIKRIADFGLVVTGKTPSKTRPENFGSDMPFIKTPDMHGNIFCLSTGEALSTLGADSQSKKTVPENSICVSCIGTAGVVTITGQPSQTNQQINSLVPKVDYHREFLYFSLVGLKETINAYGANGATMVNLNKSKFEGLEVIAPDDFLLESFHFLTSPLFELIKRLQKKSSNLRAQRDLLLPNLVSGEIDVSDIPMPNDTEVEAA